MLTAGGTVDEAAFPFGSMERSCQVQLLAEAAAANGLNKVIISDDEAAYNFKMQSDPSILYADFQAYYDDEHAILDGASKM